MAKIEKANAAKAKNSKANGTKDGLLELESKYCSWGDTVHYIKNPNIL